MDLRPNRRDHSHIKLNKIRQLLGQMGCGRGWSRKPTVTTPLTIVRVFTPSSNGRFEGFNHRIEVTSQQQEERQKEMNGKGAPSANLTLNNTTTKKLDPIVEESKRDVTDEHQE